MMIPGSLPVVTFTKIGVYRRVFPLGTGMSRVSVSSDWWNKSHSLEDFNNIDFSRFWILGGQDTHVTKLTLVKPSSWFINTILMCPTGGKNIGALIFVRAQIPLHRLYAQDLIYHLEKSPPPSIITLGVGGRFQLMNLGGYIQPLIWWRIGAPWEFWAL